MSSIFAGIFESLEAKFILLIVVVLWRLIEAGNFQVDISLFCLLPFFLFSIRTS